MSLLGDFSRSFGGLFEGADADAEDEDLCTFWRMRRRNDENLLSDRVMHEHIAIVLEVCKCRRTCQ